MNWDNIIIANIGWSEDHVDTIKSNMGFVREYGDGAEKLNFHRGADGRFYGYVRGGHRLDDVADRTWTIVFVSRPFGETGLRVVGWYEDAQVAGYGVRPEYADNPSFQPGPNGEKLIFSAVTEIACLVPSEDRDRLCLPKGHRIKNAGIYYAAGNPFARDSRAQVRAKQSLAEWARTTLRPLSAVYRIGAAAPLPEGVRIDEDGKAHGFSSVAEGERHQRLKRWACANAQAITGRTLGRGEPELPLLSGDWVDAAHEADDALWLVEVKSNRSPEDDLRRGVYQCIKYRAVAAAQPAWAGRRITAVLLTERALPAGLQALAEANGITLMVHELTAEDE